MRNKINDNIAIGASFLSLITVVVTATMFLAAIDKTNAIQETQIGSMNSRLDKIEAKIDQLFYKQ